MMKLPRRQFLQLTAGAAALPAVAGVGWAQTYPTRPVKIVVSLPVGSAPDIRARIVADQLTRMWGRQVVVENRPGGGGVIGAQAVFSASADGYTLLYGAASTFTILPAQNDRLTFDVNRDLIPIGLTANEGMILAVSPKLGVESLGELITLAKEHPYKFIIGTNPAGSLPHLAARLFISLSQAPMTVVPSTGGTNEAIREIMGGRVHAVIEAMQGLRGALDAGDLKALAIMTRARVATVSGHTHSGGDSPRAHCGRVDGTLRTQGDAPGYRSAAERRPSQGRGGSRCPCASRNSRRNALPSPIHGRPCAFH